MKSVPIGIVMLNDERKHVWEKNNPENMKVVHQWVELIKKNLVHTDGTSPEIIAGSEIITSTRVAQKVGEELVRAGCKIIILCYNVWNFPFLVWPFLNTLGRDKPILSLSNNNGKYPGNVGLLATDGALRQVGLRTHRIVGDMDDPEVIRKVTAWLRAAEANVTMRNEVFGIYGGHSMGMETGYYHLVPTIKFLGTTGRQIDQLWLLKVMENDVEESEVEKGLNWFETLLGSRLKYDGKMLTPETLKTQIRLYLAMELVNKDKGFDLCGLKGQRELTEHVCLGDVAEMMMNDPYDWRGPKESVVCATEADAFAGITMQIMKYISGGLPTLFMDVRLYDAERGLWDWCNSGNHSSYYAEQSFDPEINFKKISFHPALELYFKAGGASVEFDAKPGQMTFARVGLWDDRPFMVIMKGESLDLPEKERKAINASTDPTWPHVHARLSCSFDEFIHTFPCNHVLGVAGDCLDALVYFCEQTKITPVVLGPECQTRIPPIWERME